MENMVTRCPQCKTSFRITPAQLKTARGAVRCGSCLTIFKASENLISDPKAQSASTQAPASAAEKHSSTSAQQHQTNTDTESAAHTNPKSSQTEQSQITAEPDINDDELISDDMHDEQADFSGALDDDIDPSMLSASHRPSSSLFERKPKAIKDEPIDQSDESWAVSLLEEDEDAPPLPKPATGDEPLADDKLAALDSLDTPDAFETGNRDYDVETQEPAHQYKSRSDVGSFTLIADDENDSIAEPAAKDKPSETPIAAFDPERSALLSSIEADPVEMAFRVEPRTWPKKLLWASLSLVALCALYIQWNVANFNDLARQQPYRGWYSTLCPLLSCQLPSLSAPEKISSYNLVVRSHPKIEQALIVDTIILNRAPFEQPFPKLTITFSDRDDTPIARRQFTPAQYLRGELAGRTLMPSGQPIHIALELSDPGPHAVNYSADIAP